MKKIICFSGILAMLFFLFAPEIFSQTSVDTEQEQIQQKSEEQTNSQNLPVAESAQTQAQAVSEGFERVPVRTVYGPLGIIFKTLEITLQRMYILFEF